MTLLDMLKTVATDEAGARYFRQRYAGDSGHICPNCSPDKTGTPLQFTRSLSWGTALLMLLLRDVIVPDGRRGFCKMPVARIAAATGKSDHAVTAFFGAVDMAEERLARKDTPE